MSERTILLAAGGTGGHLFPAFALAEELARRDWRVELATDMRGDRYGTGFPAAEIHRISSATLRGRSPLAVARTASSLTYGVGQAFRLLGRVRPAAVVGFGGYPCFPPLVGAWLRGIPTILHEQNAVLGRANRMLARRVSAIATSFDNVRHIDGRLEAKVRLTGNPVRDAVIAAADLPEPPVPAPVGEAPFTLLVFGGSQGARFFSTSVPPALLSLPDDLRNALHVIQQCREEDLESVRGAYAELGIDATCETFFSNLPELMASSHLVIGRAGASSVAELTVIGRPSILVPLPHALDNDQLENATSLAKAGGAWCIEQEDLTLARLREELANLIRAPCKLKAAAVAAKSVGRPDAVQRLADLVEEKAASKA